MKHGVINQSPKAKTKNGLYRFPHFLKYKKVRKNLINVQKR